MASGQRYTHVVTALKLTLPLLAIGLLSTLFLFANAPDPEEAIPYAEVDVEQLAREQRLNQPRFAGLLDDGRELTLRARTMTPNFDTTTARANAVFSENVTGRLVHSEDEFIDLDAATGRFDMNAQQADLAGGVTGQTNTGFTFRSPDLRVVLTEFSATTTTGVEVTGPTTVITAEAMELTGPSGASVLSFTGNVRLIYQPLD